MPAAFTYAGLVRRYCDHGAGCGCDLPRAASGWTVEGLADLRRQMREHGSLRTVAIINGRGMQECNLALDALFGRTEVHALAVLEARAERTALRQVATASRPIGLAT